MMIWAWIRGKLEHKWPYYGQKCSWWELWELSNEQLRPRKPKQGAERCYKVIPMRNWVSLNELVNQSKQLFFPVQVSVGISDSIIIESFKSSSDFSVFPLPNCLDVLLVKYWLCFLQRWLHPSQEIPTQWALIPPPPQPILKIWMSERSGVPCPHPSLQHSSITMMLLSKSTWHQEITDNLA